MPFKIIRNDITKVKVDAIVNTANPEVAVRPGVDATIYDAAGRGLLLEARRKIGVLKPGEVGITPAFNLPAKYVIHSSGPVYRGGADGEPEILRRCYDKSLELAAENGCGSIAFPLMATGAYGFPEELGMQIAIDAFTDFLEERDMEITLVVFGDYAYKISGRLYEHVESYIDDKYVADKITKESRVYRARRQSASRGAEASSYAQPEPELSETAIWGSAPMMPMHNRDAACDMFASMPSFGAAKEPLSLDERLKAMYADSFSKHLQQLINKKGLKNSEVYAAANISKQYFSKLLKGQVNPSKEKVLALAVGLRLNVDEAVDFLKVAGYAFSPVSQTDVIVEYFLQEQDYNVIKIDIVLFDYGLPALSE